MYDRRRRRRLLFRGLDFSQVSLSRLSCDSIISFNSLCGLEWAFHTLRYKMLCLLGALGSPVVSNLVNACQFPAGCSCALAPDVPLK